MAAPALKASATPPQALGDPGGDPGSLIRDKAAAALCSLGRRAAEWRDLHISARTHNVAAQTTTMGKRVAMFGEELLGAFRGLEAVVAGYPARGLKGAVGTQLDQLALFDGDPAKVAELERGVVVHLGLPTALTGVGQVYPRSLDLRVVSAMVELCAAPSSFCKTLRLMAGHELAGEGFAKGQVGSSAMPHKMNARSCERVNGFHTLLKGYLTMAAGLSGDQWNEGDVSCSVVRRAMLPDAFFAADGLLETFLTILGQMEVYPDVVARENDRYLPFLTTTTFLMEAVKAGAGRESAHEAIKEHAVAALGALRSGQARENDLLDRLAGDERLGIGREQLDQLLSAATSKAGAANEQVEAFLAATAEVAERYPEASRYTAGAIL